MEEARTPAGGGFLQGFRIVYAAIPLAIGVLSVLKVFQYGLNTSLSDALNSLLIAYNKWAVALLGWMEPALKWVLGLFDGLFSIDLHLHDHWRHMLVIVSFYYFRDVINFVNGRNTFAAVYSALTGALCAMGTAIFVGAQEGVETFSEDRWRDFAEAENAIIVLCLFYALYGLLRALMVSTFEEYKQAHLGGVDGGGFYKSVRVRSLGYARHAGVGFVAGSAFAGVFTALKVASPAILTTCVLVFALSCFHLFKGWERSAKVPEPPPGMKPVSRWERFFTMGNTQLGLGIFGIFCAAALIFLIDAGGSLID